MSDQPDLLARTAELVGVASVSHNEGAIADLVESLLRPLSWLRVERVGDNVVARTERGAQMRLLVAGHLDTVPAAGNEVAIIHGERLSGLGAVDMKGGLAVMLELARRAREPAVDVTWVFYSCEEVDHRFSGLEELGRLRADLLVADAAVLAEPTGALVEVGCQGTMRVSVTVAGRRAHSARPWAGVNAIHRLGRLLAVVDDYEGRRPVLDGCEFAEALQAVRVEGGVANNVVPDWARVVLNHRFAPDRDAASALAQVRAALEAGLGPDDVVELEEAAPAAAPRLDHPLLAGLVASSEVAPRAKLGWTDVSWFAARGIPATNFGPGDPELAHTPGEWVDRGDLDTVYRALSALIAGGPRHCSRPR